MFQIAVHIGRITRTPGRHDGEAPLLAQVEQRYRMVEAGLLEQFAACRHARAFTTPQATGNRLPETDRRAALQQQDFAAVIAHQYQHGLGSAEGHSEVPLLPMSPPGGTLSVPERAFPGEFPGACLALPSNTRWFRTVESVAYQPIPATGCHVDVKDSSDPAAKLQEFEHTQGRDTVMPHWNRPTSCHAGRTAGMIPQLVTRNKPCLRRLSPGAFSAPRSGTRGLDR